MNICYVKAYFDWIEQTAALSDAERGRLFIAILEYARTGLEPKLDGREGILFPVFRTTIDRDKKKSATYSENGKKNGKKQNEANESKLKQNEADESELPNIRHKTQDIGHKTQDKDDKGDNAREARFVPPSVDDVRAYCLERKNSVDPEGFVDFYESKGWIVGKTKMKDWKAAVRNWERSERPKERATGGSKKPGYNVQHHGDDLSDLQRQAVQRMMDGGA